MNMLALTSRFYLALLLMVLLQFGCKDIKSPEPETQLPQGQIDPKSSYINIPISYSYAELEERLNDRLSHGIFSDQSFDDDETTIVVEKNGEIKINKLPNEQQIDVKLPIKVLIKKLKAFQGSDNEDTPNTRDIDFEAIVWLSTPVSIGSDWSLRTACKVHHVEWLKKPTIKVGPLKVGIARKVERLLKGEKSDIPQQVDSAIVQNVKLRDKANQIWGQLHNPILLNRQVQEIWLTPSPTEVHVSPIYLTPYDITGLVMCHFDLRAGPKPKTSPLAHPLPAFRAKTDSSTDYKLHVLVEVGYEDLSKALERVLANSTYEIAGHELNIKKVTAFGNGQKINLKLDLTGDVDGVIYMEGKPSLKVKEHLLCFEQVDFDMQTSTKLVQMANWLLHDEFKTMLEEKARFELAEFSEIEPEMVKQAIGRSKMSNGIELNVSPVQLKGEEVVVQEKGVQLMIEAHGQVILQVSKTKNPA